MEKLFLLRLDGASRQEILIEKNETLLGRGSFLSVSDKKVSRNHAILTFSDGSCSLKSIHVNPCFVQLKTGKKLVLKNGGSVNLVDGDEFSLLQDKYMFLVKIRSSTESADRDVPQQDALNGEACTLHATDTSNDATNCVETKCQTSFASSSSCDAPVMTPKKLVKIFPASRSSSASKSGSGSPSKKKRKLPAWMASPRKNNANQPPSKKAKVSVQADSDDKVGSVEPSEEKLQNGGQSDQNITIDIVEDASRVNDSKTSKNVECATTDAPAFQPSLPNDPVSTVPNSKPDEKQTESDGNGSPAGNTAVTGGLQTSSADEDHISSPESTSEAKTSLKEDNVDDKGSEDNIDDIDDASSNDENEKTSSSTPAATRPRDSCAYGRSCYRKNPLHFQEFSHPGDLDYVSPPPSGDEDDDRPECEYGLQCYRKNPVHRREYKHTRRVTPRRAATRRKARKFDDDESDEDDYDLEDSFIDDEESAEESVDEDSEWNPSQDAKKSSQKEDAESASETEDVDDLLADAKNFAKNRKMWKS